MSNCRILHISDSYPGLHDTFGGAEVISSRLVDLFNSAGWQQGLLVTKPDHPRRKIRGIQLFFSETMEDLLPEEKWITALKGQLFPYDPVASQAVSKTLEDFKPHVVLLHTIRKFSLHAAEICKQDGVPVLLMVYDYIHVCPTGMFVDSHQRLCAKPGRKCISCHTSQAKTLFSWSEKLLPIRSQLFTPLLKQVNGFVVLSEASRKQLSVAGIEKSRIEVIGQPLGFDGNGFQGDPNHILFIGWGQPRKGLLVVAKALRKLKKPFTFEAIGALVDDDYVHKVRNELRALGLDPDTCLRGRVDDQDVAASMKRAGIVVVAEQWENMSPAILHEAMAARKVVVAGSIGGIPEFVSDGENCFLARFNDPANFAQKINSVLGDREKQKQVGQRAVLAAKRNTDPSHVIRKFRRLFDKVTKNLIAEKLRAWANGCSCVIVCGGNGSRFQFLSNGHPKSLLKIQGKPLIRYIMDFWSSYTQRFVLIANYGGDRIRRYVEGLPYETEVVIEKGKGCGVARALLEVEGLIKGRFVMVLGDCLYAGPIDVPDGMDRGVGVFPNAPSEMIAENFSLDIDARLVRNLTEKPNRINNHMCGMGVYFLDGAIWRAIRDTRPDKTNTVQITSVLKTLANQAGLFPVYFRGGYVNVNHSKDLDKAEKLVTSLYPQGE